MNVMIRYIFVPQKSVFACLFILGLQLTIYVEDLEYLSGYTETSGYNLNIDSYNTMASAGEAISISPGYQTNVGITYVSIPQDTSNQFLFQFILQKYIDFSI